MRLIYKIAFIAVVAIMLSCNKNSDSNSNSVELCEFGVENLGLTTKSSKSSEHGTIEGAKMQITLVRKSSQQANTGMYHYDSSSDRLIADGIGKVADDPEIPYAYYPDDPEKIETDPLSCQHFDWSYLTYAGKSTWFYFNTRPWDPVAYSWKGTYTDHKLYVSADTYHLLAASKNRDIVENIKPTLQNFTSDGASTSHFCSVYVVDRNEDNYYLGRSKEPFYITSNRADEQYIYNAGIVLKQQISKMRFNVSSNKYNAESGSTSGHEIEYIKLKNCISKLNYCASHGQHISDDDIDTEGFRLKYDGNDGVAQNIVVAAPHYLKCDGQSDGDDFINLLALDYSKKSDDGLSFFATPYVEVQYYDESGTLGDKAIKILPINYNLEPQTKYQIDITLTMTTIDVSISEYKNSWEVGEVSSSQLELIDSYSIDLDGSSDYDWDENGEINTQI